MSNVQDVNLIDQLNSMCLNEKYSDVVFHIGDVQLPGHQNVLAQRSPVFDEMFSKDNDDSKTRSIILTETSVDAFKPFLKFIYTGIIDLKTLQINVGFGVLRLAITYKVEQLDKLSVDHFKSICNADNVCDILNAAAKLKHTVLIAHCLEKLKTSCRNMVTADWEVFRTIVDWMKANPGESDNFPELFKQIELRTLTIDEMIKVIRPLEHIDGKVLLDIAYEQAQNSFYADNNIPILHSGVKITAFESLNSNSNEAVDLERLYMLNYLEMELAEGDWSYWIETSKDNANWTRIIDYSKYICRSVQRLYFKERPLRYIRIYGNPQVNGTFKILRLEACHQSKLEPTDPQTGVVIPSHNVALAKKNAVVLNGHTSGDPNGIINGSYSDATSLAAGSLRSFAARTGLRPVLYAKGSLRPLQMMLLYL